MHTDSTYIALFLVGEVLGWGEGWDEQLSESVKTETIQVGRSPGSRCSMQSYNSDLLHVHRGGTLVCLFVCFIA